MAPVQVGNQGRRNANPSQQSGESNRFEALANDDVTADVPAEEEREDESVDDNVFSDGDDSWADEFVSATGDTFQEMEADLVAFIATYAPMTETTVKNFGRAVLISSFDQLLTLFGYSKAKVVDAIGKRFLSDALNRRSLYRLAVLVSFLQKSPLKKQGTAPDYASFKEKKDAWVEFVRMNRRNIKDIWSAHVEAVLSRKKGSVFAYSGDLERPNAEASQNNFMPDQDTRPPLSAMPTGPTANPHVSFRQVDDARISSVTSIDEPEALDNGLEAAEAEGNRFMDAIRNRERARGNRNYTGESIKTRRIQFDLSFKGQMSKFPSAKALVESSCFLGGISHCVDEKVLQTYISSGGDTEVINLFVSDFAIMPAQFAADIRVLYGMLLKGFNESDPSIMIRHRNSKDGMKVYNDLLIKYEEGANKEGMIEEAESQTTAPYYLEYPNGMTGYAEDMELAFVRLEQLSNDSTHHYNEASRIRLLARGLRHVAPAWLVDKVESTYKTNFTGAITFLRRHEKRETNSELLKKSKKKGRLLFKSQQEQEQETRLAQMISELARVDDEQDLRLAQEARRIHKIFQKGNRDDLHVHKDLFYALSKDAKKEIIEAKKRLIMEGTPASDTAQKPSKPDSSGRAKLPNQYGRANKITQANDSEHDSLSENDDVSAASDSDSSGADSADLFEQLCNVYHVGREGHIKMVRMNADETTVRAHTEWLDRQAFMVSEIGICTSDNGADSTVLGGQHWTVMTEVTKARMANLIGFDHTMGARRGLPIVDAVTKATTKDGRQVLLGVHDGVLLRDSNTTLLSEFQVRYSGLVCDSVSKDHKLTPHGDWGTQTLYIDRENPDSQIPFVVRNSLMTFAISKPTPDELQQLPVFWITQNEKWRPTDHCDEPASFAVLNAHQAATEIANNCTTLTVDNFSKNARGDPVLFGNDAKLSEVSDRTKIDRNPVPNALRTSKNGGELTTCGAPTRSEKYEADKSDNIYIPSIIIIKENDDCFVDSDPGSDEEWTSVSVVGTRFGRNVRTDENETDLYFFDPSDADMHRYRPGRAFKLTLDVSSWQSDGNVSTNDKNSGICKSEDDVAPDLTQHDVDDFLDRFDNEDLFGGTGETFDSYAYAVRVSQELKKRDYEETQRKWTFRPLDVVKRTFEVTTWLAKPILTFPMKRHFQARFPFLSQTIRRLPEAVSTDPVFANVKNVTGENCAQTFFGLVSHVINVYGMRSKKEFPHIYKDFIREEGIPTALHRDNAPEERSKEVTEINRKYVIKDRFSEPYYPWQNPVESRAIRFLKAAMAVVMDRTGAPDEVWLFCLRYIAEIHNRTADFTLSGCITPMQMRTGITPDISAYLLFRFYERIYYLDTEESFPSSKEKAGFWLGVAHNTGDMLTFYIITEDHASVITRSVIRSAETLDYRNLRVDNTFEAAEADEQLGQRLEHIFAASPPIAKMPKRARRTKQISNKKHRRKLAERKNPPTTRKNRDRTNESRKRTDRHNVIRTADRPDPIGRGGVEENTLVSGLVSEEGNLVENPKTAIPNPIADPNHDVSGKSIRPTPVAIRGPEGPENAHHSREKNTFFGSEADTVAAVVSEDGEPPAKPTRKSLRIDARRKRGAVAFVTTSLATANMVSGAMFSTNQRTNLRYGQTAANPAPLEQDFSFVGLTRSEMKRMRDLQLLDSLSRQDEDNSDWDVLEVTDHRLATNPRKRGGKVVKDLHMRVKATFRNGDRKWVQADAVRSGDPFPLLQYIGKRNLVSHKWFSWAKEALADVEKLKHMRQVFKATVEKGPKYKFGIEVPRSPRHALYLDKVNGNNLWEESMKKEFDSLNEHETFKVLEDNYSLSSDYKKIPYHIVFDVKFDLRRKSRLVAGGNWTDPPKEDVYSGVVSLDTVRLGFTLASMKGLLACAADVGTAFLYGRTREKVFVIAGPEFGPGIEGKRMLVEKGLYGLRSSGARFHEHLSTRMRRLGFLPSKADADFWYKDAGDHYEYIATYVDDLIVFAKDPMNILNEFKKDYVLKGVGTPEYYLGGNVEEVIEKPWNERGISIALSAKTYIKNATEKLESLVGKQFKKEYTPMLEGYHPELDDSPLLDPIRASKYRAIIGSANWVVSLGRFDVAYATNTMARYSMAPREGHFKQVQRIFGYLSSPAFIEGRLLIDPSSHDIADGVIKTSEKYNWQEFYPDATEEKPPDVPKAKTQKCSITVYVDADHAHDQVTRRSVTGILVFVNNTLVKWYSKQQRTVETSTYSSELVASRIATEMIMEYRYLLRSVGMEIDGPARMLGDNNAVVLNTTLPSSQLKKKHQAVAYHRVREAIAGKILEFHHIPSYANYSDVMTKPLSAMIFHSLIKPILFRAVWKDIRSNFVANEGIRPSSTGKKKAIVAGAQQTKAQSKMALEG